MLIIPKLRIRHKVWTAIALHTSAGIAERIDPLTRLVRFGVKLDFSKAVRENLGATSYAAQIEDYLPRLNIEKVLADAVVRQAVKIPESVDRFVSVFRSKMFSSVLDMQ